MSNATANPIEVHADHVEAIKKEMEFKTTKGACLTFMTGKALEKIGKASHKKAQDFLQNKLGANEQGTPHQVNGYLVNNYEHIRPTFSYSKFFEDLIATLDRKTSDTMTVTEVKKLSRNKVELHTARNISFNFD